MYIYMDTKKVSNFHRSPFQCILKDWLSGGHLHDFFSVGRACVCTTVLSAPRNERYRTQYTPTQNTLPCGQVINPLYTGALLQTVL